jgi:gentisate 1,2-dioxygenase
MNKELAYKLSNDATAVFRLIQALTPQEVIKRIHCHEELLDALKEIAEGKGAYSQDQFEHCKNTVRDMKQLAIEAIAKAEGK